MPADQPALFGFDPRDRLEAAAIERAYRKGLVDGRHQAATDAFGVEPSDLGEGYHELELAHGRWYALDELGARVMVSLQRPYTLLRWKALEGRRQATEGWEREWGTRYAIAQADFVREHASEADARGWAERVAGADVVSRLVGPWEPDEQHEPVEVERVSSEAIASVLAVVDAPYRQGANVEFVDEIEPASGGVVEQGGPLTAEEADHG
jgi:hypothetical protein